MHGQWSYSDTQHEYCSRKRVNERCEQEIRKTMTMYGVFHPKSDVDTVHEEERGRQRSD